MNVKSKALRTLGMIGGILLSILLVITLMGTLFFSVSATLTQPQTIVTVVKQLDLTSQVLESEAVVNALETEGIQTEMVTDLVDSPFFQDTVGAYTDEIVAVLQGEQVEHTFSEDTVRQFADEHMGDLIELAREHMPQSTSLSDEQIENAIGNLVDDYGTTLVEALPTGEKVQEMLVESEILKPAQLLVNTTVPVVLYSIVAVLAVLVFVCMLHKFRGLLCLGIDALVAAAILLVPYLLLAEGGLVSSLLGDLGVGGLLSPLLAILTGKLATYLIILAIVAVLFIAGYIVYVTLMKKRAAQPVMPVIAEASAPTPAEET